MSDNQVNRDKGQHVDWRAALNHYVKVNQI